MGGGGRRDGDGGGGGVFYCYMTFPLLTFAISKYHDNFVYDWPGRHCLREGVL